MRRPLAAAATLLLAALPLRAQIPDARLVPRGVLRWAFTPAWRSWDRVLDADGNERLLRGFASADSAGASLFSTLAGADSGLRSITATSAFRIDLGALRTALDADARRFPLEFSIGAGSRLSLTGTFPLVVTRMNAALTLDSTSGNSGWNQAVAASGSGTGAAQVATLLTQLDAGATALAQRIGAGTAACAQPQTVLARIQAVRGGVARLAGTGATPPAAAPTASSAAGVAVTAALAALSSQMQACGVTGLSTTMPLPSRRLTAADVQTILTTPALGYGALPFDYTKLTGLGDVELGVRLGAVQSAHTRVVLTGGVRLPTGTRDSPQNLIDLAPADHQLDLTAGLEAAFDPGTTLSLSLAGWYTRQFPDALDRRVAPQEQIITAAPIARVRRDLGDEISLSAFPGLRLNEAFRVYAGGTYYHKGQDRYSGTAGADSIGARTAMQATSFTGGVQYRSVGGRARLPVEAGLTYSAVYTGSGGFTPKATTLTMYLRFYYRLWGGGARESGR